MPITPRPRRSMLFMPGSNARALDKARELPADGLIFDLEDAVAPARKEAARIAFRGELQAQEAEHDGGDRDPEPDLVIAGRGIAGREGEAEAGDGAEHEELQPEEKPVP